MRSLSKGRKARCEGREARSGEYGNKVIGSDSAEGRFCDANLGLGEIRENEVPVEAKDSGTCVVSSTL